MHPNHRPATRQQQRVRQYASNADSCTMFNLLTGPQLPDRVQGLVPDYHERLFPPTETLSMSVAPTPVEGGSDRQMVDDAMVKRGTDALGPGDSDQLTPKRRPRLEGRKLLDTAGLDRLQLWRAAP